jgi:hypothetical protein
MSDSAGSWFTFNSPPASARRTTRVKLHGSILAIVQHDNQQVRARVQQVSTSGGVLQLSDAFAEAAKVDVIFHIGSTTLRAAAEMLKPMWSTQGCLQAFRFLSLSEDDRRRLGRDLSKLLAGNRVPGRTTPATNSHFPNFPPLPKP